MLLFVDQLTNVDFSYLHPSRGVLGETWLASIELEGDLDAQGMVCDFGTVKATTRRLLDELIDHRLLVPAASRNLTVNETPAGLDLHWRLADGQAIDHHSPPQCVTLVDCADINPDAVARWCEAKLREQLPLSVQSIRLRFTTERIDTPFYQYSHGLKKHAGKCQRIAHGHRSRVHIWRDGEAAPALEEQWAETLRDSYIGTREDLQPSDDTPPGYYRFAYSAAEGEFSIQLPQRFCHLLDTDSTVEHIAAHIAQGLKDAEPNQSFRVRAFEGIGKGAVVDC